MPVGLLAYTVADFLHSRRRTLSAVLGVFLAMTFVSGTFIAIDSSTRASLDALLRDLPGHFQVGTPIDDPSNLSAALRTVPGVVAVNPVASVDADEIGIWNSSSVARGFGRGLAIDRSYPPAFLRDWTLEGSMTLARGSVVLSKPLAVFIGAHLGGSIYLGRAVYDPINYTATWTYLNLTVEGILIPSVDPIPNFDVGGYGSNVYLVDRQELPWIRAQLRENYPPFWQIEVWIQVDRFVDPYDLEGTRRNLNRLQRSLSLIASDYGGYVSDMVSFALESYEANLAGRRTLYLLLSLPVILLGLTLGAVGIDLAHAERRRELAVLKARGASRRQVVGLLLMEALLGGFFAALLGLVAGALLSRTMLDVVNPFTFGAPIGAQAIFVHRDTILAVLALGILLMAAVSFRSARRTAGLPVVETLRYYSPGETKLQYRPTIDAILVGLAVTTYAGALYARSTEGGFLQFLVGFTFLLLVPFAPVLLILGATRLLTRATGRTYEWAARVCKPFAKNLYHVISRNLSRNPRRSANVAVVIAFGLAFGVFTLSTLASQQAHDEQALRFSIGADVAVSPIVDDPGLARNLSALSEVAGVTRLERIDLQVAPCCPDVYALDPTTFFQVTQPEPWYFDGLGPADASRLLATNGNALVSKAFFQEAYLEIGDRLALELAVFNVTTQGYSYVRVNVTIAGVVRGLPGAAGYGYYPPGGRTGFGSDMPRSVYVSYATISPILAVPERPYSSPTYFVDLRPDADWSVAKAEITALGIFNVRVYPEELAGLSSNPFLRYARGFIDVEIAFVAVILTAGLGLIIYAASLERDVEFASIIARGSSRWQTAGLLVGEAVSILIIGAVIGIGVGAATSFLTLQTLQPAGAVEMLVPYAFVLPLDALLLLGLAPLAMVLTATLIAARIARMDVARVLKVRGG